MYVINNKIANFALCIKTVQVETTYRYETT